VKILYSLPLFWQAYPEFFREKTLQFKTLSTWSFAPWRSQAVPDEILEVKYVQYNVFSEPYSQSYILSYTEQYNQPPHIVLPSFICDVL